jgi:hypothetical protein
VPGFLVLAFVLGHVTADQAPDTVPAVDVYL